MASKMTDRLPPNADSPAQEAAKSLTGAQCAARNRVIPASRDDSMELEEVETMLQSAIQAMSPDAEEISKHLERAENVDAAEANRRSRSGLVLVVIALVILILSLDLLLAGM